VTMPTRQSGFTYLFVLMLVAFFGLGLAAAGQVWHTEAQRAREADLLFIGNQYRRAIQSYYEFDKNAPRLPQHIEDLLEDNRQPEVRHLRRAWRDPFTGDAFELIPAQGGSGFIGVASRSTATPFKRAGFDPRDSAFTDAATYSEWHFVFVPPVLPAQSTSQNSAQ